MDHLVRHTVGSVPENTVFAKLSVEHLEKDNESGHFYFMQCGLNKSNKLFILVNKISYLMNR